MKTLDEYMAIDHHLKIVEDKDEGGFVASYPELPGCITCGETKEEVINNALDAKRAWLEAAIEDGVFPKDNVLKFEDIQKTVAKYGKAYGAENIYLFGSYARGDATEHSDIDLRIDKGSIVGGIALAGLLLDIEGELGVKVDLVTTGSLSKDFLFEIRSEEILLYTNHS